MTLFVLPFHGCELTTALNKSVSIFTDDLNRINLESSPRLEEMASSDQDTGINNGETLMSGENISLFNREVRPFKDGKRMLNSLQADIVQLGVIETVINKEQSDNKSIQMPFSVQNRNDDNTSLTCNITINPKDREDDCESDEFNNISESYQSLYGNIDASTDINVTDPGYSILNVTTGAITRGTSSLKKKLYIGGLFDLSGSRGETLGRSELTAAALAIDHINKKDVLLGYELKLITNDTGVSFVFLSV